MPRNVRNFWIEVEIDGRKTRFATGPVRKDGGFNATVLVREQGCISDSKLVLRGFVEEDQRVVLQAVAVRDGEETDQMQLVTLRDKPRAPEVYVTLSCGHEVTLQEYEVTKPDCPMGCRSIHVVHTDGLPTSTIQRKAFWEVT